MSELNKSIKAIFFDLDETLIPENDCMLVAIRQTSKLLAERYTGIEPAQLEAAYFRASHDFWSESNNVPRASGSGASGGNAIRIEVWGKALSACNAEANRHAVVAAELYAQERKASYRLFPEVEDVLNTLRQQFVLGIITNGADTQREKLKNTSLNNLIDTVIISGEVGVGKPEGGIFVKALSSVNVTPKEAIYVGDSLNLDIAGAKNARLFAVWLNRTQLSRPPNSPKPDSEINNLRELLVVLGL